MVITSEQVMPLLLVACPSFSERWEKHCAFYDDENLLYVDLREFACHLIELYQTNEIGEFPAVFQTIEALHLEGDDFVREASVIGILEAIQNVAGNSGLDPELFVPYLRPESVNWWQQLNDFWNGKIPSVGASRKKI